MDDRVDISFQEKVKISSGFVLCSPPGEVNDVFNDVRTLVNNDEALQDGILEAIEQYNVEQYITVTLPGSEHEVIISQYGKLGEDRFLDPRSKQSFKFDHIHLTAHDLEDYATQTDLEPLRVAVEKEMLTYVEDHYPNGVCTIYATDKDIIIAVVDNKYNPNNFWNGRWLASWIYDTQSNTLKGCTKVNVHYYEDGNVQLNTEKNVDGQVASNDNEEQQAKLIVKEIASFDRKYHSAMNNSYNDLAEDTFKGLRRALPMTRNKMDWNKILNYKIGSELAQK